MTKLCKRSVAVLLLICLLVGSVGAVGATEPQTPTEPQSQETTAPSEQTLPEETQPVPQTETAPVQEPTQAAQETTEETVSEETEPPTQATEQEQTASAPQALGRELMNESFDNGNGWNNNATANISFADGKAQFNGGGAQPHMVSKNTMFAKDMLIQTTLQTLEGNTNCNTKIGFRGGSSFGDERLQLRFDYPNNRVYLEKAAGNTASKTYAQADVSGMDIKTPGKTLNVSILVKGSQITVWLNDTQIIDVTDDTIAAMPQGPILVAGQYPNQKFALDNLVVTTDEEQTGKVIPVTLKVFTDGVENPAGGTLAADRESGRHGDQVNLTVKANHGYVFQKYTTNTDNLIQIENDSFQLNDKFDEVVVTAHFVTRQPGKDELYFEDFGGQMDTLPGGCTVENEQLIVDVPEGQTYGAYKVDESVFDGLPKSDGYRITLDFQRMTGNKGTLQIAFRGGSEFGERYVLAINADGSAMLRRFHNGKNDELVKVGFDLKQGVNNHAVIEVNGTSLTLSVNGKNLFSYEDKDQWNGMEPCLWLINMTKGAAIGYDNVLVEKIPPRRPVSVITMLDGVQDTNFTAGTVTLTPVQAAAGDTVTLNALVKAGYTLKGYELEAIGGSMTSVPQVDEQGQFVMPEGDYESIVVKAVFEKGTALREGKTFYIDGENGDDAADGLTPETAWKTVSSLAARDPFQPGDQILLKRGTVFTEQQLAFQGMGTKDEPIIVGAYGDGEGYPRLDGNGKIENVVSLNNQQYITVRDLEITNLHPDYNQSFELNKSNNTKVNLRAVNVSIKDFGVASGIHIQDCYIHDINGNNSAKWNGGVFFDVQATIEGGQLQGVPSKYDDISITGCTFERVDRSAIKLVSSRWCNQWQPNDPGVPVNWYPSTNVVVRDNYMEYIGGDGITVRDTDGALIEHNLAKDCRYQNTGYNVGIWPFEAANTVLQYNESFNTHGTTDGQGLDCDHASSNSVMQYNYSHNNEGGFMLIMGGYNHIGATVRYNISQNDRDKVFEFAQGLPMGTMIYNNTLYSDNALGRGLFMLSNTGNGQGIYDAYVFNNVFCYPEDQVHYTAQVNDLKAHMKLYNNAYIGVAAPEEDTNPLEFATIEEAGFVDPGKAPEENNTHVPYPHSNEGLMGYQLKENSPLKDKGVTLDQAMTYYGVSENGPVDGRALSPRALFDQAKAEGRKSIDCVVGENYPQIPGVRYDVDFFGNPLTDTPDLGAAEFTAEEPLPTEPTVPETTEPTVPETTEPTVPETTEPSVPETTEPSVPETTEPSVPETTAPPATTKPDPNRPATGDSGDALVYAIGLLTATSGLVAMVAIGSRKKREN